MVFNFSQFWYIRKMLTDFVKLLKRLDNYNLLEMFRVVMFKVHNDILSSDPHKVLCLIAYLFNLPGMLSVLVYRLSILFSHLQ